MLKWNKWQTKAFKIGDIFIYYEGDFFVFFYCSIGNIEYYNKVGVLTL